jgi:hypothetical protein
MCSLAVASIWLERYTHFSIPCGERIIAEKLR